MIPQDLSRVSGKPNALRLSYRGTAQHIAPTVDFTALAHVSRFVAPDAYRPESNTFDEGSLEDVAFHNPDGSLVLLFLNATGLSHELQHRLVGKVCRLQTGRKRRSDVSLEFSSERTLICEQRDRF